MTETFCLEVQVPAVGTKDFMIPAEMKIGVAKRLIADALALEYKGLQLPHDSLWLIDAKDATSIPESLNVAEAGLNNGSKVMLVSVIEKEG